MGDFDIREILCEILGGLLMMLLILAAAHAFGAMDISEVFRHVAANLDAGTITSILLVSYIVGLLVDSIGLSVGEAGLDNMVLPTKVIAEPDTQKFWTTAPEHVVRYRDQQWMYYSAYRNVFVLLLPGTLLFTVVAYQLRGCIWAAVVAAGCVGLLLALWRSAKCLLSLYRRLPAHFV